MASTAVRVALRVRPLTHKERLSNCTERISFVEDQPQILIGKDHSFTYDYVFDSKSEQQLVYNTSVIPLVEKFVDGFNATILAYGQTGSGKTFSMGTALDDKVPFEQQGIVPRFIYDLFDRLNKKKNQSLIKDFKVYVSFLELYNEEFVDLLNIPLHTRKRTNSGSNHHTLPCEVQIREDVHGQIYWSGVREEVCSSPDDLFRFLTQGSFCRTTGSTDMNSVSSRSHAIFSVILKQTMLSNEEVDQQVPTTETTNQNGDSSTIVSKFHFVDLAGSERLKRTKAEGDRAREGISINSGLLALGNVISALGDESRKSAHVPYRDSKLTRLLQDSLGGNSQTLMMACVSPSDSNFAETLSTLKYANRARNIKNKVSINQEYMGSSLEVNQLRSQVAKLKLELNSLRRQENDKLNDKTASDRMISNMIYNNGFAGSTTAAAKTLKEEINRLKTRVQSLSDDLTRITVERDSLQLERELAQHLGSSDWPVIIDHLQHRSSLDQSPIHEFPIISHYQKTIQSLRQELIDTQERLAFSESVRPPPTIISPHQSTQFCQEPPPLPKRYPSSSTHKTREGGKKKRILNGSTTTTTKTITFRSSKRSKVPKVGNNQKLKYLKTEMSPTKQIPCSKASDGIDSWLQETISSVTIPDHSKLTLDVKNSVSNTKIQIEKVLKALNDIKSENFDNIDYNCDILDDNEIFLKLESNDLQSLIGDIEEDQRTIIGSKSPDTLVNSPDLKTQLMDENELIEACRKHPEIRKILNQIQSNIQLNEDLVHQLEKTDYEYAQMRERFQEKFSLLRNEILELRQQQRQHQTKATDMHSPGYTVNHIKAAYENKMKSLMNQLADLSRKYNQTTSSIQSSRNQNEGILRSLRSNVESLKEEKRRMIKRMKEETERVKNKMHNYEREIQRLQRKQQKDNEIKKRFEREAKQMQTVISKKTDESLVTAEKLKSLVLVLKKAVREGGILDEKMLSNCAPLLNIGSALIHSAKVGHMSHSRRNSNTRRRQRDPAVVKTRACKKKELLDSALFQFIQGKQAVEEMKQLLAKRNDLSHRKIEYLSERELLIYDQENINISAIDLAFIKVIDENIEAVETEIEYIDARIHAIHNDAATEILQEDEAEEIIDLSHKRVEKKVTFAEDTKMNSSSRSSDEENEDDWLDMDAMEEKFSLAATAGPEKSLEMISKILKSMNKDETSVVMESVIDDLVLLRTEEHNNKRTIQQLEKSVQDLRRTLIVMKKIAIDTSIENEKKIKRLQYQKQQNNSRRTSFSRECRRLSNHSLITIEDSSDVDSAIDLHNEENYQHIESMFEKIYTDGINGKVQDYEYGTSNFGVETASPATLAETELSPYLRPQLVAATTNQASKNSGVQAPMKPSASPLVSSRRNSTSSPEQFLLQFLQTPKTSQPPHSPLMKPADFIRYQQEREHSTTSSLRSRACPTFVRRSSLHSEAGSNTSFGSSKTLSSHHMTRASSGSKLISNATTADLIEPSRTSHIRPRSSSLLQTEPPLHELHFNKSRRSSLLKLSTVPDQNMNDVTVLPRSPLIKTSFGHTNSGHDHVLIPAFNNHHPTPLILPNPAANQKILRSNSILAYHATKIAPPRPPSKVGVYSRNSSPSTSNDLKRLTNSSVFDRLSASHTHSSQAKKKATNRYSASHIDDLKKQWDELSFSMED